MNKKITKIMTYILLVAMFMIGLHTTVFATSSELKPNDISPIYEETGDLTTKAGKVMGLIRNIAVIGGVLILMFLGVKYMLGSVEEKADYKKSLIPLAVGIFVVMAATQIMTMLVNFFS